MNWTGASNPIITIHESNRSKHTTINYPWIEQEQTKQSELSMDWKWGKQSELSMD